MQGGSLPTGVPLRNAAERKRWLPGITNLHGAELCETSAKGEQQLYSHVPPFVSSTSVMAESTLTDIGDLESLQMP